jgi:hypothetical protein
MSESKLTIITGAVVVLLLLLLSGGRWLLGQKSAAEALHSPLASQLVDSSQGDAEGNTIVFSTPWQEGMPNCKALELIYTEAFSRMEYDFELFHQPPERSLADANVGLVDGDAHRGWDMEGQQETGGKRHRAGDWEV